MAGRDIVLWAANDVLGDDDDRPLSDRVTDVFYRSTKPRPGSVLLGLGSVEVGGSWIEAVRAIGLTQGSQQVATGKDRVRIVSLLRLDPVPLADIWEALPPVHQRRLDRDGSMPRPLVPIRLSPQLGQAVLVALRGISPGIAQWLDALGESGGPVSATQRLRLREERDAVSLAVEISGVRVPDGIFLPPTSPVDGSIAFGAVFMPEFVTDTEDDLLAEDLRRFDRKGVLELRRASVARFTDRDFALTIMNVNRKPLEKILGVDLIYWDEMARTFTLVQYKRLTQRNDRDPGLERWAFTRRAELEKQLGPMNLGRHIVRDSTDWRFTSSPFWFKFVRAADFKANESFVLKGMYVPAEYLRRALIDGSLKTGPRSGFEITYKNTRYLPRESFVELVRRGFVGTTRTTTARVLKIIDAQSKFREVIVAMKTKSEEGSTGSIDSSEYAESVPF
jgi:hypothetical protein